MKKRLPQFKHAVSIFLFLTISCSQPVKRKSEIKNLPSFGPTDFVKSMQSARALLKERGVPENMILRIYETYIEKDPNWSESALRVIEPTLFGFLYHGNYLAHDSLLARKTTSRFIRSHQLSFDAAKNAYQVAPEAIAALLWVETKFGKNTGSFPIPWVYFSLSLVSQPDFCNAMRSRLPAKLEASLLPEKPDLEAADQKLQDRCKTKSDWAIEELKALATLETSGHLRPFKIKGSFAGAFGLPQFIPSSYQKYAVSSFRKKPDLFIISDAILSVGHYLSKNGWKNENEESQMAALYSYNRSRDYGTVIRQIASGLTP